MRVARLLVTPKWLLRHVAVVALCIAFFYLSRWQWHRGHESSGTIQNYGYAVEWLVFGGCVCFAWWKLLTDELHPDGKPGKKRAPRVNPWQVPSGGSAARAEATATPVVTATPVDTVTPLRPVTTGGSVARTLVGSGAGLPASRSVAEPVIDVITGKPMTTAEIDPDDAEVLAYNAYLSALAERPVNGYRAKSPIPSYLR